MILGHQGYRSPKLDSYRLVFSSCCCSSGSWWCYRFCLQAPMRYRPICWQRDGASWRESILLGCSNYTSLFLDLDGYAISLCTTCQFYWANTQISLSTSVRQSSR